MALLFDDAVAQVRGGQPVERQAELLLAQLTQEEKLALLDGDIPFYPGMKILATGGYGYNPWVMGEIARLGIPGIRFTDGPRGIVTGTATCFPVSYARGATWDTSLEERIGRAIGLEGRARGANFYGGVCINLPRHPAWGRSQETYGEDPIILGEFGVALTKGIQQNLIACVKHFALNSIENARFKVNVKVDEAVLHETYLPHFKKVIVEGGVLSVMSAYNSVNGSWCGENKLLLQEILREKWGFSGLVISDFLFGIHDPVLSLQSGLDIEAPLRHRRAYALQPAIRKGLITDFHLDRAGKRILGTLLNIYTKRLPKEPKPEVVFSEAHRNLAREAAARSMVLLKNAMAESNEAILPLHDPRSTYALIGRLANRRNTGDHGSSDVRCPEVVTPYEGLRKAVESQGGNVRLCASSNVTEAVEAASQAATAILIVGNSAAEEGESMVGAGMKLHAPWPNPVEIFRDIIPSLWAYLITGATVANFGEDDLPGTGGDRKSLKLKQEEIELIEAVSKVNSRTIVVVISGGPVIVEPWISKVPAVLFAWYSGAEGGSALAEVLFGQQDASGRLPASIPKTEHDLPFFDASASEITYDRWYGQRLLDHEGKLASFPLGFGLSYTAFAFSEPLVSPAHDDTDDYLMVSTKVANTGNRPGWHVVQVYGQPLPVQADFPIRSLLGFTSINIEAGQENIVKVKASLQPMKRWKDGVFLPVCSEVAIEVARYSGDPSALRLKHKWQRLQRTKD